MKFHVVIAIFTSSLTLTSCAIQSEPMSTQSPELSVCDSFSNLLHARNEATEKLTGISWDWTGGAVRSNSATDFAFAFGLKGLEGGSNALGGRVGRIIKSATENAQNLKELADLIDMYPAPTMQAWAAQMKNGTQMSRARELFAGFDSANWELVDLTVDASAYCIDVIADSADLNLDLGK